MNELAQNMSSSVRSQPEFCYRLLVWWVTLPSLCSCRTCCCRNTRYF